MKIPYRWLREFVDTEAPVTEVAERLTMAGIEVAGVAPAAGGLSGVVVGEVREVAPHPGGGGLSLCRVVTGAGAWSVACGAPNVRPGLRAAFAPPGAVLPDGRRLEVAVIRGVPSEGMLCSEAELGLGEDASVILGLDATAPVGADLVGHLGLDDPVLEVEVTPNRPDCLCVAGIAREVAALTRGRFLAPVVTLAETGPAASELATVAIEDPDGCARYAARVITGVRVGPSPGWLARRLRAAGLRPINNVVDATNYVLWELGHPLHAFDQARLVGRGVVVRRARAGESIQTLDGQARTLTEAMLVIADRERAVGVAGVMGGANTEVGPDTRSVLLESAYFEPGSIRRTARALGLSTEASYRFERGADIEGLRVALDRTARLIAELAGGQVARGAIDVYPRPRPAVRLSLRFDRIRRVVGASPPRARVGEVLRGLGFPVEDRPDGLAVEVPSFRRDVTIEDDLVEEVVRVWGYGEIPATLPAGTLALTRRPRSWVAQDDVRRALVAAGYQEAITLSLIDPAYLVHAGLGPDDARTVVIRNPLARDRSVLRPSLLFGLLEVLSANVRRQSPDVRLFEIGRVFASGGPGQLAVEDTRVAVVLTGLAAARAWFTDGRPGDLLDVKGAAELVMDALGRVDLSVEPLSEPWLEEGRGVRLLAQGTAIGWAGELHPTVQAAFAVPTPVVAAELSLDRLESVPARVLAHRPLPRFPGIQRDLAAVVRDDVPEARVRAALRAMPTSHLRRVTLFDVYGGDQVASGHRSLAYSLFYQADDRTLTDAEVNALHAEVVERLRAELGAEVRGMDRPGGGTR
jgi:phenylalanyl-tRNA synthetase beta chain